jgi:CubicO group peptidase (beta-lactamase class C family)
VALSAQEVARTGPPPEIRKLVDGVIAAINGDSAGFETFALANFAPSFLEGRSPADRAELHRRLQDDFGTVTLERVMREGPSAPLDLHVKGARTNGVVSLDVGSDSTAPRVTGLRVRIGDGGGDASAGLGGLPQPPVNRAMTTPEIERGLDGYFTKLAADEVFSGVALVARNGVPVFFKAYGYADREKKVANTVRTRFNIGSINKSFTQAAIRQLVQAGKLAPTDTLGKFFPDYPQAASRAATVQQLLDHRAGLADFFGPEFRSAPKSQFASNADYFAFVSSRPPLFAPGERNQYCNGCYIALGAIVEKVSGMPYEKYVAENVFARAEMTSTGYPRSDSHEPDIAIGYTRRTSSPQALKSASPQPLARNTDLHGVTGSAAGGGYSTALDLLTYVKAVRAGKFPGAEPDMGIAGGAPGINAIVEAQGEWVVIVLTNFDPPTGQQIGVALADALNR